MNKIRNWKRFAVVGCSHGTAIDPVAAKAVLKFKKDFKPNLFIHAGDFIDAEAFMGNGKGDGESIAPDIQAGLEFLEEGQFNVVLNGNHEDRIWRLVHSKNEIVAECSMYLKNKILKTCKGLKAKHLEYSGIEQKYLFSNALVTHGTIYNENSCRDMAEMYNEANVVIFAHTHKAGFAKGRRSDNPSGYCVGTLARKGALEYAKTRRSTLAWSQAIVYGEYSDDICIPHIYVHPQQLDGQPWLI